MPAVMRSVQNGVVRRAASCHALHTDEQRAIVDFAERSGQLNPARQDELAALLEPLATNRPNVETLLANARWFRGHSQPTSNDTNSDRSSRSKL